MTTDSQAAPEAGKGQNEKLVIAASSLGTVFEWYDFYLYGLLATALSHHFFSGVNETTGFILALMAFAAGFAVRPFGALVFGRVARRLAFLLALDVGWQRHMAIPLHERVRRLSRGAFQPEAKQRAVGIGPAAQQRRTEPAAHSERGAQGRLFTDF